ncbi:hypothetical protein [Haloferax sp. KTX1]|uniref:hypothetical protein n=1 Tax=Haloferax sp. KTX1 TaxID=2600597 RepID=UPI0011DD9635|nr:hypothetical protein [Haloferax sp. KTX1]
MATNSSEWFRKTKNRLGIALVLYVALLIYAVPTVGVPMFELEVFTGINLWFVLGWMSMPGLAATGLVYSFVIAEGTADV